MLKMGAAPGGLLFVMRSLNDMKCTGTSKMLPRTRFCHAVANVTPSMCVEMSIRTGATPIWYTTVSFVKVSGVTPSCRNGAPNFARA